VPDINCAERLKATRAAGRFYGFSVLYCMTTSLSGHGEGLAPWVQKEAARALSRGGSSSVRRALRTRSTTCTNSNRSSTGPRQLPSMSESGPFIAHATTFYLVTEVHHEIRP
jgi:hypothetical protein